MGITCEVWCGARKPLDDLEVVFESPSAPNTDEIGTNFGLDPPGEPVEVHMEIPLRSINLDWNHYSSSFAVVITATTDNVSAPGPECLRWRQHPSGFIQVSSQSLTEGVHRV